MRVVEAIDLLCETPAGSALKGEFEGLRRLRVGHYRVVYEWQRSELVILVVRIGHRREVYR
jgi:mRNA interferase RelE/StbE